MATSLHMSTENYPPLDVLADYLPFPSNKSHRLEITTARPERNQLGWTNHLWRTIHILMENIIQVNTLTMNCMMPVT